MTREQSVFILANQALAALVAKIEASQWDMKIPAWFKTGRTQADMTLRTIVNYHAYDDAWVPDVLAGKTMAEVGTKYDGDLLGEQPAKNFAAINSTACEAVRQLRDPSVTVHLSYGNYSAKDYLQHTMCFRGFRFVDIAKLIGADTAMPSDLVQGMWEILTPHAEEWRKVGVFGPEIPVSANAALQERLLGMSGRTL
jgi:hypothetical protein